MPNGGFRFGPFHLDLRARRLLRDGVPVPLQPLLFDLLLALVSRHGEAISKDELLKVGWPDQIVNETSLTQAISRLRTTLDPEDHDGYIQTVPRYGYRFAAPVESVVANAPGASTAAIAPVVSAGAAAPIAPRAPVAPDTAARTDADLKRELADHIALIDGRALLETLEEARIAQAMDLFRELVARDSGNALFHVGLANACALRYELTRAFAVPDTEVLLTGLFHGREACRLNPRLAEAYSTLGFIYERTGDRRESVAALRKAVELEPDIWQHHLRHALGTWGDERLRAARCVLKLFPGLPAAHCLVATVFIARDVLGLAEEEIDAALAANASDCSVPGRVWMVAINWLKGLFCLAREEWAVAIAWFDRELALEPRGQLYSRECCASAWYAKGYCLFRLGDRDGARAAYGEAIARAPRHLMAHVALALLDGGGVADMPAALRAAIDSATPAQIVDAACAHAAWLVAHGDVTEAARGVRAALDAAPSGNAGWLLPLDPLLHVSRDRQPWIGALASLRARAGAWMVPET